MESTKRRQICLETSPTKKMNNIPASPHKKVRKLISPKKLENQDLSSLFDDEEDFDFLDENDFNKENSQNNLQEASPSKSIDLSNWTRCIVKQVERDTKNFDLILHIQSEDSGTPAECTCKLQGPWCHTEIDVNDVVSIQAVWSDAHKCFVVNTDSGFIVTNPDYLISGTSVVGSLFCRRKGVLQDKFRGLDADNKIMVIGSIIHELLQCVLSKKLQSYKEIEKAAKDLLNTPEMIFILYSSKMTAQEIETEVHKFLPNITSFVDEYIIGNKRNGGNSDVFAGTIDNIQDIEENLWVPRLGLKGKIDVSVHVRPRNNFFNSEKKYMPLELKTGRASFSSEHKGQLILYQMMLTEIGKKVDSGLLLYLREGIMKEVPATRNERRDLIMLRNNIAYYHTRNVKIMEINTEEGLVKKFESLELPEPVNHHSFCSKCPYNTICTSFLKMDKSNQISEYHPLVKVSRECTSHLSKEDLDYFIKWCGILSLEDKEQKKSNQIKHLWTETPEERKSRGRTTIVNLKITGNISFIEGKYIHTFKSDEEQNESGLIGTQIDKNLDFTLSGITPGDYVTISSTKRIAIAAGHVYELHKNSIAIRLERNLTRNYRGETFVVDKYESSSGNIFNYTNLGVLLDDTEVSNKLRKIIIERMKPTFTKVLPKIIAKEGVNILVELNPIQRNAVMKALTANDYMLIKGLPGTGKTQTLVTIIRLLNIMGKSVLITSHTHSAVDNILLRLKSHRLKFIRLGAETRISPHLHEYSENNLTSSCSTPEDLAKAYSSYNIVGVTCLGSAHSIFIHRKFDVCIVDEATQVFQSTVLRPLYYAKKFILVGDPEQLPPLVKSKTAKSFGAEESLFQRLDSVDATSVLTLQYRMNKGVTKIANELTYKGELRCANDTVMMACLNVPKRQRLLEEFKTQKWILRALEQHVDQSVVLLDTLNCFQRSTDFASARTFDASQHIENAFSQESTTTKKGRSQLYTNYCDAAVSFTLVKALLIGGYRPDQIGIIAPYRAQVELLRKLLENYQNYFKDHNYDFESVEVNTVDQYQGRDKDLIIYSCTKSSSSDNIELSENEILEDRRRLTVAITRSKHKLIMIGDQNSLLRYTPFKDLFAKIPAMCKIKLEDGRMGFSWETLLTELRQVMDSLSL